MFLNPALSAALDRIAERAADVRRAFSPGVLPEHDDVATPAASSDFTLNPLAVAAPPDTYFIVRDRDGHLGYTRDGVFAFRDGRLVDSQGRPVCGAGGSEGLQELRADPVDVALGRVQAARIEPDGAVVYQRRTLDPRSGIRGAQHVTVGNIVLARFPAATRMENVEGLLQPQPSVAPARGLAGSATFGKLIPMRREHSRIDIDLSLMRLKEAYMRFEALAAAENTKGRFGKTATELLK